MPYSRYYTIYNLISRAQLNYTHHPDEENEKSTIKRRNTKFITYFSVWRSQRPTHLTPIGWCVQVVTRFASRSSSSQTPHTIIVRDHRHHKMNSSIHGLNKIVVVFYLRATEVYHCVNRFHFCITMPCLFARQVNPYKHYNIQKKLRALPWCCWCHSGLAISARSAMSSSFRILNLPV